jgi:hypothetical protein
MEKSIFKNIEESFSKANKGLETINVLIYRWGICGYLLSYFVINKLIFFANIKTIDVFLALIICIYFGWHIFALNKCKPKKPQLSPEEKNKIKIQNSKEMPRKILRIIFLKQPIFKWNTISVVIALDLIFIAHFSSYFFN